MRTGGSNCLLVASRLGITLIGPIDLVIDPLLLVFLVHDEDTHFSLGVGPGDVDSGIGDEGGVGA